MIQLSPFYWRLLELSINRKIIINTIFSSNIFSNLVRNERPKQAEINNKIIRKDNKSANFFPSSVTSINAFI